MRGEGVFLRRARTSGVPAEEVLAEGQDPRIVFRRPGRRPDFVRRSAALDWHLWFAALDTPEHNPWVLTLCEHLLRGTPEVLALPARKPLPRASAPLPPRPALRVPFHRFRRARRTGHWWRRTLLDTYVPPSSLNSPSRSP